MGRILQGYLNWKSALFANMHHNRFLEKADSFEMAMDYLMIVSIMSTNKALLLCFCIVPEITGSILPPGISPILGRSFSFMCQVDVANDIDIAASFTYTLVRAGPTTANRALLPLVSFDAITMSDEGFYQCFVEIISPYIDHEVTIVTTPFEVLFTSEYIC